MAHLKSLYQLEFDLAICTIMAIQLTDVTFSIAVGIGKIILTSTVLKITNTGVQLWQRHWQYVASQ